MFTGRVTVARQTDVFGTLVEVLPAPLTVGAVSVVTALETVPSVSGPFVQLFVEVAFVRETVAVAR